MQDMGIRIRRARENRGMTLGQLGSAVGVSAQAISQWEHGKTFPTHENLGAVARALGVNLSELTTPAYQSSQDAEVRLTTGTGGSNLPNTRNGVPANAGATMPLPAAPSPRKIPVRGRGVSGEEGRFIMNGETVDWVSAIGDLDGVSDAYAVYVEGDSMEPRYSAGDVVFVHPTRPPRKGCSVVVQTKGDEGDPPSGYIKQFVQYTPTRLVLRQFNPDKEISFELKDVVSVHRIVGSAER